MILVFFTQKPTVITMDGIFSYTLANNPYTYLFIDDIYDEFPQNNGWVDAHILKENYVAEKYDRFNYSAVYHHQRHDVHPPLYYFAVHTASSLFPGKYSNLYTMGINLIALFLSDFILIKMCGLLYDRAGYGVVPIAVLMSMESMRFLLTWARMYMMLFLFCMWYLYIHAKLLMQGWKKSSLIQMIICIFLGTLTHYYFYIYAASLTILAMLYLMLRKERRALLGYIYSGIVGITASWIFYPWVLWHIFKNEQSKHTDIDPWSLEKGKEYLLFLKNRLLNDSGWACVLLLILCCLGAAALKQEKDRMEEKEKKRLLFRKMTIGSGMLYSVIVYTLDGDIVYYSTALYMAFIVWVSMTAIDLVRSAKLPWKRDVIRTGMAVICVGMIYPGTVMRSYLVKAGNAIADTYNGRPLVSGFWQVPETHRNYNCIYIEGERDSLLHNYWFAFGEYRLFKIIPLEEFLRHGIREEDLVGCEREGDGVIVYAPQACEFDERDYRWVAGDSSYTIYEYVGEAGR